MMIQYIIKGRSYVYHNLFSPIVYERQYLSPTNNSRTIGIRIILKQNK